MLATEVENRPDARGYVRTIEHAQNHLRQLFNEVRGYAAPIVLERDECSLASIWRQAWANLHVERHERRAELVEEHAGVDLTCQVDPFRIEQVFRNILENALAATADAVHVQIKIRCRDANVGSTPALQVSFRDNGPGMTAEQRQRVFEPFFTTKTSGTGLGMAIARRIVEAHGGEIAAVDCPSGAEIVVTLPKANC
jgi:signal transduction histidine kinase